MDGETGQLVWSEIHSTQYNERLAAAACDADGNLYVVGRAFGTGFYDIIIQKFAGTNGVNQWTRTIGSAAMLDDIGWDIAVDGQGRPVVCGMLGTSLSEAEAVVAVLDAEMGMEQWRATVPGAVSNIEVMAGWLAIADDDDVILGTRTWSTTTGYDVVLARFDAADGRAVYQRQWNSGGTTADDPRAMIRTTDGDLVFAGVSGGDYLVARFDGASGDPVWQAAYAGPPDWYDVATCLAAASDGTLVASGFSDGSGTGWDVATVAFAPDTGEQLWAVRHDGEGQSDEARSVAGSALGDGGVTGYSYSYDTGNDLLVLCYETGAATAAPDAVPAATGLTGAWPNPFNPRVTLSYALPRDGMMRLSVCDLRGREIAVLVDGFRSAGDHTTVWNGRRGDGQAVASGLYLAVLQTVDGRTTRKLMLGK